MKCPLSIKAMFPLLILAFSVTGLVGCKSARNAFRDDIGATVADVDTPGLLDDAEKVASSESSGPEVALVSSTSKPSVPTLRTLAADEDLMAAIEASPGPVLLDFYADWCGPCRTQGKVLHDLESFAAEQNAQIIKVDIEKHPVLAKQFKVASLPTLVVIKDGEITSRQMGLKRAAEVRELLR